jgi:hypothetical protein
MKSHSEEVRKAIPTIKSSRERYIGFRENLKDPSRTITIVGLA